MSNNQCVIERAHELFTNLDILVESGRGIVILDQGMERRNGSLSNAWTYAVLQR